MISNYSSFNYPYMYPYRKRNLSYISKRQNTYLPSREIPAKEKIEKKEPSQSEDALFNLFGVKLHFDDVLLICLIFFLYNEGVKDEYLFIVLILLLLS